LSRRPAPTRADHERFCVIGGWVKVRNARGKTGTHHVTYELTLPDGRILRTRISHPPDRTTYGVSMWGHILRDQLDVSEDDFWECLETGVAPTRGDVVEKREGLPADLVYQLVVRFRIPEQEVKAMTKAEAVARLHKCWAREV
jgi:hypothetical protein